MSRRWFLFGGAGAALLGGLVLAGSQFSGSDSPTPNSQRGATDTPVIVDEAAVRARAWQRAEPLLAEAERQAALALEKRLASIHAFLAERKPGARAFAERLLGLRGKWELVKSQIAGGGEQDYAGFISQAFREHVFAAEDLEQTVATAIRGYLAELDGIEDDLLVRLRANVADDQLPVQTVIPALRSDQALRTHYRELTRHIGGDLHADLAVVVGRELFLWEATNVVTDLTLKAGAAVAARLGMSGTILSAGAASTWETLGVGLVVALVLDAAVNRIIKAAGYDAEEKVAERVGQTLDDIGRTITDGDPEARATLARLKAMQRDDPDEQVRAACAEAIESIEGGSRLYGLRRELTKISAARASVCKDTLRRLIHDTEEVTQ